MQRRVHVLGTGGTIAGAQPDPGHYGYTAAQYGIDWLLNAVPGLDRLATLSGEQVVNIGSQDMDDGTWLALARRVNEVLASADTDAALITHGTDTLEETGYFLDLVTSSDKPVVMVGSMRPATAISADGPANIYNGVAVAADTGAVGRGTLIVLNDEIHHARNAVKTGTSNPNAFSSMSRGLAGITSAGRVEWFEREPRQAGRALRFDISGLGMLPRVDILHAHANMSIDLIDAAIVGGALVLGLVIERVILARLRKLADRTEWRGDEIIIGALRGIITTLLVIIGLFFASYSLPLDESWLMLLHKVLKVLLILCGTVALARIAVGFAGLSTISEEGQTKSASILVYIARASVYLIGVLVILQSLGISITPLLTALGVGGLAVALALQDTLSNLFAGIHIPASRKTRYSSGLRSARQPASSCSIEYCFTGHLTGPWHTRGRACRSSHNSAGDTPRRGRTARAARCRCIACRRCAQAPPWTPRPPRARPQCCGR